MKISSLWILLMSILSAVSVFAQQTPQSLADTELPSLLAIYKDIHIHPELSGHEERSAGIVAIYDRGKADTVDATLANSVKKSVAEVDGAGAKQLKAALAEAQAGMGG